MPFGTVRSSDRIRELNRFITVVCLILVVMALTGCGLLPFGRKEDPQSPAPPPPSSQSVTQTPEETMVSAASGAVPAPDPQNAAAPPEGPAGYQQVPPPPPPVPLDPVIAAGPLTLGPDGTMGSLGLNLEGYFDDTADDPERLTRIERTVMALHRDMKTLSVPIQRLITVERDISALITQLGELTQGPPPNAVPVMAYSGTAPPMAASPPAGTGGSGSAVMTSAQAPPAASGSHTPSGATGPATVNRMRVGEHADKTRIVLDVSAATPYRYDLDNGEMLLVIELSGAGWADKKEAAFGKKSPLLASYAVHATESGGSRVIIQLRKGTSVSYETAIKPNGNSNYRIVIDLKK